MSEGLIIAPDRAAHGFTDSQFETEKTTRWKRGTMVVCLGVFVKPNQLAIGHVLRGKISVRSEQSPIPALLSMKLFCPEGSPIRHPQDRGQREGRAVWVAVSCRCHDAMRFSARECGRFCSFPPDSTRFNRRRIFPNVDHIMGKLP